MLTKLYVVANNNRANLIKNCLDIPSHLRHKIVDGRYMVMVAVVTDWQDLYSLTGVQCSEIYYDESARYRDDIILFLRSRLRATEPSKVKKFVFSPFNVDELIEKWDFNE